MVPSRLAHCSALRLSFGVAAAAVAGMASRSSRRIHAGGAASPGRGTASVAPARPPGWPGRGSRCRVRY